MEYLVKVEESRPASDGKPAAGPVFRCIYAKDGLLEVPDGLESPWKFFRYVFIIYSHLPSISDSFFKASSFLLEEFWGLVLLRRDCVEKFRK